MKEHRLKTLPEHFVAVAAGEKTAELRKDDRGYAVGDRVILVEWDLEVYNREVNRVMDALDGESGDFGERWAIATQRATGAAFTGRELPPAEITHILRGSPWLANGYVMLSLRPGVRDA